MISPAGLGQDDELCRVRPRILGEVRLAIKIP